MFAFGKIVERRRIYQRPTDERGANRTHRLMEAGIDNEENFFFGQYWRRRQRIQKFLHVFETKLLITLTLIFIGILCFIFFLPSNEVYGEGGTKKKLPKSFLTGNFSDDDRNAMVDVEELFRFLKADPEKLLKISQISEYCHRPESKIIGMEAFVGADVKLEQVHVLILPGEVMPQMPSVSGIRKSLCRQVDVNIHNTKLETFQQNIDTFLKKNPGIFQNVSSLLFNENGCVQGQITPLGVSQLLGLGDYLQQLYLKTWKIQGKHAPDQWLSVRTLDTTFHSTVGFLMGFLQKGFTPHLDIKAAKPGFSDENTPPPPCHTKPEYKSVLESPHYQLNRTASKNLVHHVWKRDIEMSKTGLDLVSEFMPYVCNKCLPQYVNSEGNKENTYNAGNVRHLLSHLDAVILNASSHDLFASVANANTYHFVMKLIEQFSQDASHKVFLYGADYNFLWSLLATIGFKTDKILRPSSRLVFEVYSYYQDEKVHRGLRVILNGQDITFKIPLCHRLPGHKLCSMKYFVDYHRIRFGEKFKQNC